MTLRAQIDQNVDAAPAVANDEESPKKKTKAAPAKNKPSKSKATKVKEELGDEDDFQGSDEEIVI